MAPSADQSNPTSNSGIRKLSNGESVIPSSTRADGSVRKEIRVKPGYKPPEDVELYKNRTATAWKNRGKGGVPGAQAADEAVAMDKPTLTAAKNAKRKEARKKAAATVSADPDVEGKDGSNLGAEASSTPQHQETELVDPEAEKTKEARKLAKKLRQARELRDKKDKGNDLLPEQFAKVIKINELMRQLENLGFDAEGEKMVDKSEVAAG